MNNIDLSVLVTFYNQEEYVNRALSSIFDQKTKYSFEVLIADDGSDDHTVDKIKEWIKKYPDRISLFIMDRDPNKKYSSIERVSQARVTILAKAKGKYICSLDGDDYYLGNKFDEQISFLDNHSECSMVGSLFKYSNQTCDIVGDGKEKIYHSQTYWRYHYHPAATFLFRNEYTNLLKTNFDDNTIVFSFLNKKKVGFINKLFFVYYQHDDSSWNSTPELTRIFINLRDYVCEKKLNHSYKRSSIIRHCGDLTKIYHFRKQEMVVEDRFMVIKEDNYLSKITSYNRITRRDKALLFFKYTFYMYLRIYKKIMILFRGLD